MIDRRRLLATGSFSIALALSGGALAKSKNPSGASDLKAIPFESVFVETSADDSNFTLIDSRFDETGTAAVLFGVVGASINSSVNAGEDDKKADVFRAGANAIDLAGLLTASARDTLAARAAPPSAPTKADASHVLLVEIRNWGLTRAAKDDPRLRTFLNLTWKVLDGKGAVLFEKKRENAVAPTLRRLEEFDDATLKTEIETLAQKAGAQIAYQIIYR